MIDPDKFLTRKLIFIFICIFLIAGCVEKEFKVQPENIMSHFKQYERVVVYPNQFLNTMTDIIVGENDKVLILATGKVIKKRKKLKKIKFHMICWIIQ